jgi:hypothetical protein
MNMEDELTASVDASPITGVLLVTGDKVIADQVTRAPRKAGLEPPKLKLRSLTQVIEQACTLVWDDPPTEPAVEGASCAPPSADRRTALVEALKGPHRDRRQLRRRRRRRRSAPPR